MSHRRVQCPETGYSRGVPAAAGDRDGELQEFCPRCGEHHMMPVVGEQ